MARAARQYVHCRSVFLLAAPMQLACWSNGSSWQLLIADEPDGGTVRPLTSPTLPMLELGAPAVPIFMLGEAVEPILLPGVIAGMGGAALSWLVAGDDGTTAPPLVTAAPLGGAPAVPALLAGAPAVPALLEGAPAVPALFPGAPAVPAPLAGAAALPAFAGSADEAPGAIAPPAESGFAAYRCDANNDGVRITKKIAIPFLIFGSCSLSSNSRSGFATTFVK